MSNDMSLQHDNVVVFLNATGVMHKADGEVSAFTPFLGGTIIEHQIRSCEAIGLKRFYIAIDTVTGTYASIAEKAKLRGSKVDIIQAGVENGLVLENSERLLLIASGLLVSGELLQLVADRKTPFYMTVDGREDNRRFETIDLNHRWAGIALLPAEMLDEIDELPSEWELHSTMLRRAVQTGINSEALGQERLLSGDLILPVDIAEAKLAEAQFLSGIEIGSRGIIEISAFTPIVKSILLKFRNYSVISLIGEIAGPLLGFLGFVLALLMHPIAACAALFVGFFSCQTGYIAKQAISMVKTNKVFARLALDWTATGTIVTLALKSGDPMSIFPAITMLLLLAYSRRTDLSGFQPALLLSPALGVSVLGIAATADLLPVIFGLLPIVQLVLLIYGKDTSTTNSIE
jgi:hypothetical protein